MSRGKCTGVDLPQELQGKPALLCGHASAFLVLMADRVPICLLPPPSSSRTASGSLQPSPMHSLARDIQTEAIPRGRPLPP